MGCLASSLSCLTSFGQDPIDGGHRGEIDPFIEKRGIDLADRGVAETLRMTHLQDVGALGITQPAWARLSWLWFSHRGIYQVVIA